MLSHEDSLFAAAAVIDQQQHLFPSGLSLQGRSDGTGFTGIHTCRCCMAMQGDLTQWARPSQRRA